MGDSSWLLQNDQLTLPCIDSILAFINELFQLNELTESEEDEPPGDFRNEWLDYKPVIQQSQNQDCELESDLPKWS